MKLKQKQKHSIRQLLLSPSNSQSRKINLKSFGSCNKNWRFSFELFSRQGNNSGCCSKDGQALAIPHVVLCQDLKKLFTAKPGRLSSDKLRKKNIIFNQRTYDIEAK
jgi:hypothetical protein